MARKLVGQPCGKIIEQLADGVIRASAAIGFCRAQQLLQKLAGGDRFGRLSGTLVFGRHGPLTSLSLLEIFPGRNAEANDKLTLKYSYKDDLWLHAKDVAGSHVLIKYQSGKKFPKDVIEYAAGLAAYNSKRKNESLCPVAYTPKKFVRKRKGDPAGMVVVEREEVILVEPLDPNKR